MPRTNYGRKFEPPDFSRFTVEIKAQLMRCGKTFKELGGGRNPESYRRWTHELNKIRMEDLATLLKLCKFTDDQQDQLVLDLYHLCARR